jgi:hypothetical protein
MGNSDTDLEVTFYFVLIMIDMDSLRKSRIDPNGYSY